MHPFSLFFLIFCKCFDDFFYVTQYLCMLKAPLLKIIKKLPKNKNLKLDSKLKNSNSTRLKISTIDFELDSILKSVNSTRLDWTNFQLVPPLMSIITVAT